MTQPRAIAFTEKNLNIIANTGVISRADVQALYETTVSPLNEERYFIIDYTDANGNNYEWCAPTVEFFEEKLKFTEPPTSGFRYCKLK